VNQLKERAESKKINLRYYDDNQHVGISLDETVTPNDLKDLFEIFNCDSNAVMILIRNCKNVVLKKKKQLYYLNILGRSCTKAECKRLTNQFKSHKLQASNRIFEASRFQHASFRSENSALHENVRKQGSFTSSLNDPFGLMHNEVKRHHRINAMLLARV